MHIPVLRHELIENMDIVRGGVYVDCTGGGGGHASFALEKLGERGSLIVIDRDAEAVARLKERFKDDNRVQVIHGNFADIDIILKNIGIDKADGVYADFGVSSFQLSDADRGFSFRKDGRLDMRMDNSSGESAEDIVNSYTESNLAEIIYKYAEERFARRIASRIVRRRAVKPFISTLDLAEVVKNAIPRQFHKKGIHPATKTFQALRIFVNGELEAIEALMDKISEVIKTGGRFAAISFHSLEDRIVKEGLLRYAAGCVCPKEIPVCVCGAEPLFKIITKKPILPDEKEVSENPLSRSAKLRVAERL
ncbi:MAG: 16S rRNA (cytosine(1402)-N(4))-methyltransferase RsmH [Mucispirillum sp.]|nr:16S rRNA (cytosine(1402)-N(4))-methyltransferase RsmH [Mucispirillum sp.]